MDPITNPDLTNEDPQYWEKVLLSHGLSMKRANKPRVEAYIGTTQNLITLDTRNEEKSSGRVTPPGHGPDQID